MSNKTMEMLKSFDVTNKLTENMKVMKAFLYGNLTSDSAFFFGSSSPVHQFTFRHISLTLQQQL